MISRRLQDMWDAEEKALHANAGQHEWVPAPRPEGFVDLSKRAMVCTTCGATSIFFSSQKRPHQTLYSVPGQAHSTAHTCPPCQPKQ